jgi:hypothetical protein
MSLTPEYIEYYNPTHLLNTGDWLDRQHQRWTDHFGQQHSRLQGLGWEGTAAQGAIAHEARDYATTQHVAGEVQDARTTAHRGAQSIMEYRNNARDAISAAREDNYTVDDKFGVKDNVDEYDDEETAQERTDLAAEHARTIATHVGAFQEHRASVAQDLRAHGKALKNMTFSDGTPVHAGVQMVGHGDSDGGGVIKNPVLEHPSTIINQHPTPPPDPNKHYCGPLEIAKDATEGVSGAAGVGAAIAGAPATGGLSLAGVPAGLVPLLKSFEDLGHCENPK